MRWHRNAGEEGGNSELPAAIATGELWNGMRRHVREAPEMAVLFTRCIVKRCFACECLEALPRIVAPLHDLTKERGPPPRRR